MGFPAVEGVGLETKAGRRGDWQGGGSLYFLTKPALCLVCISVSSSGVSTAGL